MLDVNPTLPTSLTLANLRWWQRVKASTEEILCKIDSYTAKLNLHDTERAQAVVDHYEKVSRRGCVCMTWLQAVSKFELPVDA